MLDALRLTASLSSRPPAAALARTRGHAGTSLPSYCCRPNMPWLGGLLERGCIADAAAYRMRTEWHCSAYQSLTSLPSLAPMCRAHTPARPRMSTRLGEPAAADEWLNDHNGRNAGVQCRRGPLRCLSRLPMLQIAHSTPAAVFMPGAGSCCGRSSHCSCPLQAAHKAPGRCAGAASGASAAWAPALRQGTAAVIPAACASLGSYL